MYANTESQDDISPPTPNGDASHSHDEVEDSIDESSPMLNEIQSEIRNSREDHETDALVEKSWEKNGRNIRFYFKHSARLQIKQALYTNDSMERPIKYNRITGIVTYRHGI